MAKSLKTTRTLLSLLIGAIGVPQMAPAAQLSLVQYPAGSVARQPAPNVVLTLDDSGSMQYNKAGGTVGERDPTSGMYALKDALQKTFSATAQNIPDGAIRLAWNSMNRCQRIPDTNDGCNSLNGMRTLDATHRANFLNWVGTAGQDVSLNRLTASGSTPTHRAYIAAGDYLRTASTDINGPWANRPGVELGSPQLSCRRSYSILMTDGGWNWTIQEHGSDVTRGPTGARGDADGVTQTLPDNTVYSVTSDQTKVYRQIGRNSVTYNRTSYDVSTLADLAFYYWATDLAPSLTNNLTPIVKQIGPQTFGSGTSAVTLSEYWNPKNNPATWQSMTTYTIGFRDAATWPTTGRTFGTYPTWSETNDTFGGSFPDLVTGATTKTWPDPVQGTLSLTTTTEEARKVELWHMAINSRGRFIPTQESDDLVQAFKEIFGAIVAGSQAPVTGFANSSSSVNRSDVAQYVAGYVADGWKGYVRADTLAKGSAAATPDPRWGSTSVTTADKLDALTAAGITTRLILSFRDKATGGGPTSFEWANDETYLSTAQKTLLKAEGTVAVTDAVGEQRLNYLRGDRSQESTATVVAQFRKRGSRQGDIVNSAIWYVAQPVNNYAFNGYLAFAKKHAKRLPMLYVGGNDGMLHGFSGVDGSEKIAYVPKGVIQNLPTLTKADYVHRYFVDGSPFSGDVYVPPATDSSADPAWRTYLVSTLGAGGKGYFVLDVSTPGSTATDSSAVASNFLKANASALVVMDKTAHPTPSVAITAGTENDDIGHITARPVLEDDNPQKATQITRMNNGRWAVVMGNGVNSTNERPVLLIQYLDGAKELFRIPAAITGADATGNGLSAPRLVDVNGDGTPDVIYAGDLKGNLWKFNVSSATSSGWGVAGWGASSIQGPLYSAVYTAGNVSAQQPITAAPLVRANERGVGGLMVAFGTGRSLTEGDRTDTAVQSIYSVLDNTRYKLVSGKVAEDRSSVTPTALGSGVANLVQQTVGATAIDGEGQSAARDFWTVSQNSVSYQGTGAKKGWYLNLPQTGERVLDQMTFFDSSNIIEVVSEAPASGASIAEESCAPAPTEQKTYRTLLNIMDGKKPSVQVMDRNGDGVYDVVADGGVSRMTASTTENRVRTKGLEIRIGSDGNIDRLRRLPELPLRPSWRQLQ